MNNLSKKGFKFTFDSAKCSECLGICCRGNDGYIWVDDSEIQRLCVFLKLDLELFKENYLRRYGFDFSIKNLKIDGEYYCCFFDLEKKHCSIYDIRPEQCRTYPFWDYFREKDIFPDDCPGVKQI